MYTASRRLHAVAPPGHLGFASVPGPTGWAYARSVTPAVETSPSHVGICVADLDASMRFYCDGLGFEPDARFDLTDTLLPGLDRALEVEGPVDMVSQFIQREGMRIELIGMRTPTPCGTPSTSRGSRGLTHLSFYVDDVDDAAARLVGLGGAILDDTRASIGLEVVFLTDPDGTRVELMAPRPPGT